MKNLLSISLVAIVAGCGSAEGSAPDEAEVTGTTQEAWTNPSQWSGSSSVLQPGAMTGGNLNLPVCRVSYAGVWHPGKYWKAQCLFEYGGQGLAAGPTSNGRTSVVPTFQTLLNDGNFRWYRMGYSTYIPPNAVQGGSSGGQPIGVCYVNGPDYNYHVGKYWADGCNIEYSGTGKHLITTNNDVYILTWR